MNAEEAPQEIGLDREAFSADRLARAEAAEAAGPVIDVAGFVSEDYTEGEAAILARLDAQDVKLDAMLAVFEQLSGMLEQLQGKGLLDLLRGR